MNVTPKLLLLKKLFENYRKVNSSTSVKGGGGSVQQNAEPNTNKVIENLTKLKKKYKENKEETRSIFPYQKGQEINLQRHRPIIPTNIDLVIGQKINSGIEKQSVSEGGSVEYSPNSKILCKIEVVDERPGFFTNSIYKRVICIAKYEIDELGDINREGSYETRVPIFVKDDRSSAVMKMINSGIVLTYEYTVADDQHVFSVHLKTKYSYLSKDYLTNLPFKGRLLLPAASIVEGVTRFGFDRTSQKMVGGGPSRGKSKLANLGR